VSRKSGGGAVRLTSLSERPLDLSVGEDSVHRQDDGGEVPVYRAAFATPAATRHHLLTVIEAVPPEGRGEAARVEIMDQEHPLVELRQGEITVRIAAGPVEGDRLWGCTADGELAFAVRENGRLSTVGALGARALDTQIGASDGDGFLFVGGDRTEATTPNQEG